MRSSQGSRRISLELNEVGQFGTKERPRVFLQKPNESEPLMLLREKVKEAVLSAGHPVEKRPFHPHMTIARKWNADHSFCRTSDFTQRAIRDRGF
ncbi:2'-5' RNA ligase family protein [Bacillus sp. SL00103]